jgi:hypothetical protein
MIFDSRFRSYFAAASLVFYSSGCASSQIPSDAQHPASPEAPQAPFLPVGEALSEPIEPEPMAANAAEAHSHGRDGAPETTRADPSDSHPDASHAGHSGPASMSSAPSTGHPAGHGSPAPATQADQEADRWTCPMHPEVIQSGPGKCPKCGMKLVPVTPKP